MSNIKIQDVDQRIQYTATSGQTEFTIPFPFLENSDIVAYQDSTLLVLTTDYTLSGADSPSGGTLTLVSGATTGDIITIFGNTPIDRTSIYSATISNLTGSDLNGDFNRDIIMMKQIDTTQRLLQLQYAPYAEVSQDDTVTKDRWLPKLDPNHTWAMNSAGTEIIAYDITATGGLVNIIDGTTNQIDVDSADPTEPVLSLSSTLNAPGTFTVQSSTAISGINNDNTLASASATTVSTDLALKTYIDTTTGGLVDSVTGTANQINVGGTAVDPVLSLSSTIQFPGTTGYFDTNGILDENSNEQLIFNTTASAVNHVELTNAATGDGPLIQAAGDDTNIDLKIQAKGTGNVLFDGSDVICGNPGTEASGIDIGGANYNSNLKSSELGATNLAQFIMHRHSTTISPVLVGARSNSDTSSHAAVTAGQPLFVTYGAGWTGAEYNLFGGIDISVDASGTISDSSSPGRIRLQVTADGATVPSTAVTIGNDKTVTFEADIDANSNKIVNVTDPTDAQDAATKAYVDGVPGATAATQSDQETATSTTAFVNPAVQQFHPSAAKGWVEYNQVTPAVLASYNVTSVTDTSTGDFTVNWTTSFSSANYTASMSTIATGGSITPIHIGVFTTGGSVSIAAGSIRCVVKSNVTPVDVEFNSVAAYGDQ
jgi:hypothetical protein